ncbi:MAG TPA: hypothetical protein VGL93_02100 [Streptosporangiaceae bacterium]
MTAGDFRLLDRAEQLLIRDCMRHAGFTYVPAPGTAPEGAFPYVQDDAARARREGFGARAARPVPDPNAAYIKALPGDRRDAYGVALNGGGPGAPGVLVTLPQGGELGQNVTSCRSTAENRLYGDFRAWFRAKSIADDLPYLRTVQVMNDPAYAAAAARWSRCMRGRGFAYRTPQDASAAFPKRSGGSPRKKEIAAAVATAECAGRTGFAGTARRLDRAYANSLRTKYRASVEKERALAAIALPRARTIVRAG